MHRSLLEGSKVLLYINFGTGRSTLDQRPDIKYRTRGCLLLARAAKVCHSKDKYCIPTWRHCCSARADHVYEQLWAPTHCSAFTDTLRSEHRKCETATETRFGIDQDTQLEGMPYVYISANPQACMAFPVFVP